MHDLWYFSLGLFLCVAAHAEVYIVKTLRMHPWSRVKFPDVEKMREYAAMIQAREPSVDDVIGFMDGVSFSSECSDEQVEQNAFYCSYDSDTMVNNVIAYGLDGKVFLAAINFPGSRADGTLTARILGSIRSRIGIKFVWIKVSHAAGMHLGFWLGW